MTFLVCVVLVLLALYYGRRNHDCWRKRRIRYESPLPFVGNSLSQYAERVSLAGRYASLYRRHPGETCVGYFKGSRPGLLLRDPDLIRHALTADFRHFHDKGLATWTREPLMKNLFTADGDLWKLMRQNLTPAFSNAKLRAMFPLVLQVVTRLDAVLDGLVPEDCGGAEVDARRLMTGYVLDVVGACGFGLDANSLEDDASDFLKLGNRIFKITTRDALVGVAKELAPRLFHHLHFLSDEVTDKVLSLTRQVCRQRGYAPSGRNDFIDLLLELKQRGMVADESMVAGGAAEAPPRAEVVLDDELLAAQVFVFLAAGFETSSSATAFTLHHLAHHAAAQERCYGEARDALRRHGGKLCYDAVKEMKYLEMAFKETLRLRPSPAFLLRKCVKAYRFPGTDISVDEGTEVLVPSLGLHRDELHFPDAAEFIPERFHPDNVGSIKKFTYLPFGGGPRACIGERMGIMQSLAGVAAVLLRWRVSPSARTLREPRVDPYSVLVENIVGGLPLLFTRR